MSDLCIGELAALATAVLWTFSVVAWTASGRRVGVVAIAFFRLVIAGAMLVLYGGMVNGQWWPTDASPRTWLLLGVSGVFGFLLCDISLFKALMLIGPRLATLILSLTPPMAAIIAWIAVGDVLAFWHWVGMAVTIAGVAWVVLEGPETGRPHHHHQHWGRGVVLATLGTVANAVGMVLSKEGVRDYHQPVSATLIRVLASLVGYVVLITLWRRWPRMVAATRDTRAMAIVTLGTIAGPFAGVIFYMIALDHAPTGIVATIIATMPVLILPVLVFVYHEKVSLRAIAGAFLAVVGVALLTLPWTPSKDAAPQAHPVVRQGASALGK